jgi:hypothetical protein
VKRLLQDPFDYAAENRLVQLHRRFITDCAAVRFEVEPGFTVADYGPLANPGAYPPRLR